MSPRVDYLEERDRLFKELRLFGGPFARIQKAAVISASVRGPDNRSVHGETIRFDRVAFDRIFNAEAQGGWAMEETAQMLEATNRQLNAAKDTMQSLVNELKASADIIGPSLMEHVKELRAARMSVVTEVRDTMTALRDVRKFFLEADYDLEIKRLERFVALCREIQELKKAGVFDAVCDSAIRLAVREPR
jgi:hypothetical protein